MDETFSNHLFMKKSLLILSGIIVFVTLVFLFILPRKHEDSSKKVQGPPNQAENHQVQQKSYAAIIQKQGDLYRRENKLGESGYADSKGNMTIPFGKYDICFTDTFSKFAFVYDQQKVEFYAINRNEEVIYDAFLLEMMPDEPSEGLFRIMRNGKIGYADEEGNVVIEPKYTCAFKFENGTAKVSSHCKTVQVGEYSKWESDHWIIIDKNGKIKN